MKKAAGLLEALTAITCLGGSPESVEIVSATVVADSSSTGAPVATVGASILPDFASELADCDVRVDDASFFACGC